MRRTRQTSTLDDLFEALKIMPVWVGPILAVIVFALFRYILPLLFPVKSDGVDLGAISRPLLTMMSWLAMGTVLIGWLWAELWKFSNRRLLDSQSGIESIRDITWNEFERLVCEAYRRKGYLAELIGTASGDGGVDVRLSGHGEKVLVQCKQWKAYKVGVQVVRELLGVVVSEKANRGIIVTSGRFTQEAQAFAHQNPRIELVDGPDLVELIRGVTVNTAALPPQMPAAIPFCPQCGSLMVLRTARKGQHAGSQFWGCQKYPACKGTRKM